uniref:C3H1-type domain-containing protein n=1 Tax=Globodera pallida TaxID=36090 RepID=A0A183C7Z3_GLOPA
MDRRINKSQSSLRLLTFSSLTNNKTAASSSMPMFGQSTHNQPMPTVTGGVPSLDQLIALTNSACHRMETQLGRGFNRHPLMQLESVNLTANSRADGATGQNKSEGEPTKPELFKTQLCHHYSIFGTCRFGHGCWFAHGVKELPSDRRVPWRIVRSSRCCWAAILAGGRSNRQINIFGHGCLFGRGMNEFCAASVSGGSSSPPSSLFSASDRPSRAMAHRAPPCLLLGCDSNGGRPHHF